MSVQPIPYEGCQWEIFTQRHGCSRLQLALIVRLEGLPLRSSDLCTTEDKRTGIHRVVRPHTDHRVGSAGTCRDQGVHTLSLQRKKDEGVIWSRGTASLGWETLGKLFKRSLVDCEAHSVCVQREILTQPGAINMQ